MGMSLAQEFLENLWKANAEYNAMSDEEKQRIKQHHDSKVGEMLCNALQTNDNATSGAGDGETQCNICGDFHESDSVPWGCRTGDGV